MTQAETGASSAETGIPATQHQEQVLAGDQQADKGAAGAATGGQADIPASPHQQQVLAEPAAGPSQGGDAASAQQAADMLLRPATCLKRERGRLHAEGDPAKDLLDTD